MGVEASVTFYNDQGMAVTGVIINVGEQDIPSGDRAFGYYRDVTVIAPNDATHAVIQFAVTADGSQSLDLDDVSLITQ